MTPAVLRLAEKLRGRALRLAQRRIDREWLRAEASGAAAPDGEDIGELRLRSGSTDRVPLPTLP